MKSKSQIPEGTILRHFLTHILTLFLTLRCYLYKLVNIHSILKCSQYPQENFNRFNHFFIIPNKLHFSAINKYFMSNITLSEFKSNIIRKYSAHVCIWNEFKCLNK